VYACELLDSLDLNDDQVVHQHVDSIAAVDTAAAIDQR
jgi:hypothetical protein